ncbi:hypothetical protein ONE63_003822 [Megalurothrips usitatus]|uniref:Choline transporter-like protein n=1 Tax=Megalurothrips usitatus TaxID=439358 RepID=A0AAV7X7P8_9NEOP|nr:hypothetical protein ONE63_003822 [Megalurothrips usitatus]
MTRRRSVSSVHSEKHFGKAFHYEPDFKGPRDRRGCTDILCLLLFVVFLAAWALLGILAYQNGDPNRILKPTDVGGRQCGVDSAVLDKPYLLFFDPSLCARNPLNTLKNGCSSPSVCVSTCPTTEFYAPNYYKQGPLASNLRPICLHGEPLPKTGTELSDKVSQRKCAEWYMKSIPLGKYCIPDLAHLSDLAEALRVDGSVVNGTTVDDVSRGSQLVVTLQSAYEFGERVVSDTLASRWFIVTGLVGAMVLSLVYILLLRWFTGSIVWTSILSLLALQGVGIYVCYTYWQDLKNGTATGPISMDWKNQAPEELRSFLDDPNTWLAFMVIQAVCMAVLLLIVVFLRKRIALAVTLIKQGGKAVASITSTLFFPIVPWLLQLAVVVYTAAVVLYLATSGEAIYKVHGMQHNNLIDRVWFQVDGDTCEPKDFNVDCITCVNRGATCQFVRYNPPEYMKWLQVYNIFGAIWALFFISGMAQMILAATFATWYWTFHKKDVPFFVLTRSFFMSITYHSGTVAFGSLIISIVRFIRLILDYIEKQAKQYSDNSVAKCLMCFCKCCFACVEGFLKFISRNAYIMCAVHGKNFCTSAKDAFNLLMRNVIRCVVIDKIMDFVFFIGKLLITGAVCVAVYFSLRQWPQQLNYEAVPITITGIGAFLIASVFFGVYTVAVETLFLCFLEDCERNDGSTERPYYMSPSLMRIFGKKNRRD